MSDKKPSVSRVLKAYSWPVEQIGLEAKVPIEYPPEDKRIYAPMEDGVQNGNFSGQIFRELSERQTNGDLGSTPNLRERPPRDGVGDNFETKNEKKYKIGSARRVAAIKRVADRYLTAYKDEKLILNAKPRMPKFDKWIGTAYARGRVGPSKKRVDEAIAFAISEFRMDVEDGYTKESPKVLALAIKESLYDVDQMVDVGGNDIMPSFSTYGFQDEFWAWYQAAYGAARR